MSLAYVRSMASPAPWMPLLDSMTIYLNKTSYNASASQSPVDAIPSPVLMLHSQRKFTQVDYLLICAALFFLNIVFRTGKSVIVKLSFSRFQRLQGCKPVPIVSNPFPLPWSLGRKFEVIKASIAGDLFENHFHRKYTKYGRTHSIMSPFVGLQKGINTVEPQNMQAVLATKFDDYKRPEFRSLAAQPLLMPGLFTTDGHAWHHWRAMIKPHFTRKRFDDNVANSERHMQLFFQAIGPALENGQTADMDLLKIVYRMAMDTSTQFLFGLSAETQTVALQQAGLLPQTGTDKTAALFGFDTTFLEAGHYVGHRIKLSNLYWIYDGFVFRRACKKLHDMVDDFITEVCEAGEQSNAPEEDSLIRIMLAQNVARKDIVQQVMHLLVAGMDTSAAALAWTFSMLASRPQTYQKLRAAVLATFGTESAPLREFSLETLKSCKYLTWCLNETLRLFPAGPINVREAVRDTVLPVGGGPDGKSPVAVRKGARVQMGTYFMHRRKDLWGEDGDDYRPERWENRRLGWDFLPFSGGPHICIGQGYSMTQLTFALARFAQHYEAMEPSPGSNNEQRTWLTVLTPGHGVNVRMRLADDSKHSTA